MSVWKQFFYVWHACLGTVKFVYDVLKLEELRFLCVTTQPATGGGQVQGVFSCHGAHIRVLTSTMAVLGNEGYAGGGPVCHGSYIWLGTVV